MGPSSRPYRMTRRVEQVDQTRQRIVDAAVQLHGSLGPARTTIAGIAEAAGVTRVTVYRHFPDEETLYGACSAHWAAAQQLPDPSAWGLATDPFERLAIGLSDIYRFYRDGSSMLVGIYRDWNALPEGQRRALTDQNNSYRKVLREPFGTGGRHGRLDAVIGHASSFWTWHSLCRDLDLSNGDAVDLMIGLAAAATANGASSIGSAGRAADDRR